MEVNRRPHLIAIASTIGINLILGVVLLRISGIGPGPKGLDGQRMQLRWVGRAPESLPEQTVQASTISSVRASPKPIAQRVAARSRLAAGDIASPSQGVAVVVDDRWKFAEKIDFDEAARRRITRATPLPSLEPKRILKEMEMKDRTFGGMLARMSKKVDCDELRAGLRAHPESAATIVATMQERGCMR